MKRALPSASLSSRYVLAIKHKADFTFHGYIIKRNRLVSGLVPKIGFALQAIS
jgi:hypothetical protein